MRLNPRNFSLTLLAALGLALTARAQPVEGRKFVSAQPRERVEYWQNRLTEITGQLQERSALSSVRLLFLGDSITDFWTMAENPWFPGQIMGRAVWNESFAGSVPQNRGLNLGISGDRTEHVLQRIRPRADGGLGELDVPELNPEYVILMIGVNNTWDAEKPAVESVFAGVHAVVVAVHERKPGARIILQSLLPLPDDAKNRAVIQPVNQRLRDLAGSAPFAGFVSYLDLYPSFVDAAGRQAAVHFADGVHPNESGYRLWRDLLVPTLDRLRAAHVNVSAGK
jgi:beta-glucosidase